MIEYHKEGDLHLITMKEGSTSICPTWQHRMLEILNSIEANCGPGSALVLTGVEKSFCNGLNLEKIMVLSADELGQFGRRMPEIFRRLLVLPCPTVAAINGDFFVIKPGLCFQNRYIHTFSGSSDDFQNLLCRCKLRCLFSSSRFRDGKKDSFLS